MLYNYFIQYIPVAILGTLGIFAVVKLLRIKIEGFKHASQLFVESFGIYSEQSIKNTFHRDLKQYYKYSNKLNKLCYSVIGTFLFFYIFLMIL